MSTNSEINRIIARYMDAKISFKKIQSFRENNDFNEECEVVEFGYSPSKEHNFCTFNWSVNKLKYNENMYWLEPVLEKCVKDGFKVDPEFEKVLSKKDVKIIYEKLFYFINNLNQ